MNKGPAAPPPAAPPPPAPPAPPLAPMLEPGAGAHPLATLSQEDQEKLNGIKLEVKSLKAQIVAAKEAQDTKAQKAATEQLKKLHKQYDDLYSHQRRIKVLPLMREITAQKARLDTLPKEQSNAMDALHARRARLSSDIKKYEAQAQTFLEKGEGPYKLLLGKVHKKIASLQHELKNNLQETKETDADFNARIHATKVQIDALEAQKRDAEKAMLPFKAFRDAVPKPKRQKADKGLIAAPKKQKDIDLNQWMEKGILEAVYIDLMRDFILVSGQRADEVGLDELLREYNGFLSKGFIDDTLLVAIAAGFVVRSNGYNCNRNLPLQHCEINAEFEPLFRNLIEALYSEIPELAPSSEALDFDALINEVKIQLGVGDERLRKSPQNAPGIRVAQRAIPSPLVPSPSPHGSPARPAMQEKAAPIRMGAQLPQRKVPNALNPLPRQRAKVDEPAKPVASPIKKGQQAKLDAAKEGLKQLNAQGETSPEHAQLAHKLQDLIKQLETPDSPTAPIARAPTPMLTPRAIIELRGISGLEAAVTCYKSINNGRKPSKSEMNGWAKGTIRSKELSSYWAQFSRVLR